MQSFFLSSPERSKRHQGIDDPSNTTTPRRSLSRFSILRTNPGDESLQRSPPDVLLRFSAHTHNPAGRIRPKQHPTPPPLDPHQTQLAQVSVFKANGPIDTPFPRLIPLLARSRSQNSSQLLPLDLAEPQIQAQRLFLRVSPRPPRKQRVRGGRAQDQVFDDKEMRISRRGFVCVRYM